MFRCCCSKPVACEVIEPPPGLNPVEEAIEKFREAIMERQRQRQRQRQSISNQGAPLDTPPSFASGNLGLEREDDWRGEMKAVVITEAGGSEVLQLKEVEAPRVGDDEVLIKVAGVAVNRADTYQRKGGHPPPKGCSSYPGLEVSGTIVSLGRNVSPGSPWNIGDQLLLYRVGQSNGNQGAPLDSPPSFASGNLGTSAGMEHGFQALTGSNMEAEDLRNV